MLKLDDPGPFGGGVLTFLNRCRARGVPVAYDGVSFAVSEEVAPAIQAIGLTATATDARLVAAAADGVPRIAIYSGSAVGYPYWAYYAHALLSLGLTYAPLDAAEVAGGALDRFDLLVMPGGFATWGLDRAEGLSGVDAAIRGFLRDGGALLGSCGGAFYACEGRPGWLGLIDATPRFTQEYLLTGAAMVSVEVLDSRLRRGLPESVEIPYYHGPVFRERSRRARTCGTYASYISPARLFIDNPLQEPFFNAEMRGTPAIFSVADPGRRAVVFSPHPEMGEFVRKGIAISSYVSRYLPIRGHKVMEETLRFYAKEDCAGFRLIYNAIESLDLFPVAQASPAGARTSVDASTLTGFLAELGTALARAFSTLRDIANKEDAAMAKLLVDELGRLESEWSDISAGLKVAQTIDPLVAAALTAVIGASVADLDVPRPFAEKLVLTELPIRLCAAARRIIVCDKALETI